MSDELNECFMLKQVFVDYSVLQGIMMLFFSVYIILFVVFMQLSILVLICYLALKRHFVGLMCS
jgi:hypothetical protein